LAKTKSKHKTKANVKPERALLFEVKAKETPSFLLNIRMRVLLHQLGV